MGPDITPDAGEENPTLGEVIADYESWLIPYCVKMTGSRDEAEDIAHESLVKAYPLVSGQRQHPNVQAYLLRVAKHVWLDEVRKRRRLAAATAGEDLATPNPADDIVTRLEAERAVRVLVSYLTPAQRTVFFLREVFGYTAAEVASLLRMSENGVKALLHRARRRVKWIQSECEEHLMSDDERVGQRDILNAYIASVRNHDVGTLISLGQLDTLDPAYAVGEILQFAQRTSRRAPSGSLPQKSSGTTAMLFAA